MSLRSRRRALELCDPSQPVKLGAAPKRPAGPVAKENEAAADNVGPLAPAPAGVVSPNTQRKVEWVKRHLERMSRGAAPAEPVPVAVPVVSVPVAAAAAAPEQPDVATPVKQPVAQEREDEGEEESTDVARLQAAVSELEERMAKLEAREMDMALAPDALRGEIERVLDAREALLRRADAGACAFACLVL